jgi:cell division protein FtsB
MLKKYRKKIQNYFPRSRVIIIISVVVATFFTVNLIKETINRHKIDKQIKEYEREVISLSKENKELDSLMNSWQNGGQLEKEARIKLGLQRPGENAVMILREGDNRNSNSIINPNSEIFGGTIVLPKNFPNHKKWWLYFFDESDDVTQKYKSN